MADQEKVDQTAVAELQRKLDEANQHLAAILPYRLALYRTRDLELLKTNARYMRNDTFNQLVANVKRDGGLGSTVLVYNGPDVERPKVLSGNHRVMANIAAEKEFTLCMEIVEPKTAEEQTAIVLSHNAISGADDLQTLKQMYDSIASLELKAYSGIDEDLRKQLSKIEFAPITEPRLKFKDLTFLFLPREVDELKEIIGDVEKLLGKDLVYAVQMERWQEFFRAMTAAKEALNIKNSSVALMELIRRGHQHVLEEQAAKAGPADSAEKG